MAAFQLQRVREVEPQRFASEWDQRIEVLSFLVLPPNLTVLAPVTLVAALALRLAGSEREPWLTGLFVLVVGYAAAMIVVGAVSVYTILSADNFARPDLGGVYLRVGGMAMALGLLMVCVTGRGLPRE